MDRANHLVADPETITVRVPAVFQRRGARKSLVAPDGSPTVPSARARADNTLARAIARAFRWRKLIESGMYSTIQEIAAVEQINASYVSRVLRLTLLAPEIVEAILDQAPPWPMLFPELMKPFPLEWPKQAECFTVSVRPGQRQRS